MIETPLGNIRGIEDETLTMLDLRNIFKAIKDGQIKRICLTNINNHKVKREMYEVRVVTLCKDCKLRITHDCPMYNVKPWTDPDWFCAKGKPKEGEHS